MLPSLAAHLDVGGSTPCSADILSRGEDLKAKPMPVLDNDGRSVGTLTCGVVALRALRAIDNEVEAAPSDTTLSLVVEEVTMAKPPKGSGKLTLTVDLLSIDSSRCVHLPISPHISPLLPTSPHFSPYLPTSPHISPHVPTSPHIPPPPPLLRPSLTFSHTFSPSPSSSSSSPPLELTPGEATKLAFDARFDLSSGKAARSAVLTAIDDKADKAKSEVLVRACYSKSIFIGSNSDRHACSRRS